MNGFYIAQPYKLEENTLELPELLDGHVLIDVKLCGICSSDIDAFTGTSDISFANFQGHEILGVIRELTPLAKDMGYRLGDIVASYQDGGGFRKQTIVDMHHIIKVLAIHPRYILEPTACAINIANEAMAENANQPVLLIGSGYLALVAAEYLKLNGIEFTVLGSHNKEHWSSLGIELHKWTTHSGKYDTIINMTASTDRFDRAVRDWINPNGTIVMGGAPDEKMTSVGFSELSWRNVNLKFPSPRNPRFCDFMWQANRIDTARYWTHRYRINNLAAAEAAFDEIAKRKDANNMQILRAFIEFVDE